MWSVLLGVSLWLASPVVGGLNPGWPRITSISAGWTYLIIFIGFLDSKGSRPQTFVQIDAFSGLFCSPSIFVPSSATRPFDLSGLGNSVPKGGRCERYGMTELNIIHVLFVVNECDHVP
jgi:hypothetical protein